MNNENLIREVQQLRAELEQEKRHRQTEERGNLLGGIIWFACVLGTGYWLFTGGFGSVARFLFWMGLFQR